MMQRIRACRHEGKRGAFKLRASGHASMPAKSAHAALFCAGAVIRRYCTPRSFHWDDLLAGIYEETYVNRKI
eukprot:2076249-Pleurochrysis_carterae.AAC.1